MKDFIAVFIGSGLGGMLRYGLSVVFSHKEKGIPSYTLTANILACFIIGFLAFRFMGNTASESTMRLLLVVGFCGGLSTYSSFGIELFHFAQKSHFLEFILYATITFVLCLLAIYLGSLASDLIK